MINVTKAQKKTGTDRKTGTKSGRVVVPAPANTIATQHQPALLPNHVVLVSSTVGSPHLFKCRHALIQQYRQPALFAHWFKIPSVPSDFTRTIDGSRYYRGTTTACAAVWYLLVRVVYMHRPYWCCCWLLWYTCSPLITRDIVDWLHGMH